MSNDECSDQTILAKNLLSSDTIKQANWEMTLKSKPSKSCFSIGYVEDSRVESIKFDCDHWIGENEGECSLYIDDYNAMGEFRKLTCTNYDYPKYDKKYQASKVAVGDKFEIQFDFIEKQCSCFWNGEIIGILDDKLPDKIYPAMSSWGHHEFECTKWELFYIKHLTFLS